MLLARCWLWLLPTGTSPLDAAITSGKGADGKGTRRLTVVNALLSAHADPNQQKMGGTGSTPLFVASQEGMVDVVAALLSASADPNIGTAEVNATPLFIAAMQGHAEVAAALVAAGADPNVTTADIGATPLFMACQEGHAAVVNVLLKAGAKIGCALTNNGKRMTHNDYD